jgi:biopolymer transport protein ExbB
LVATAVGLLVAIPAVVAYNVFKGMVKDSVTNTEALSRVLMAELKSASKNP